MTRSDKWDRIEKIRATLKNSIFNVPLLILVGLFVFGATFAYIYFFVPPIYASEVLEIFAGDKITIIDHVDIIYNSVINVSDKVIITEHVDISRSTP